MKNSQARKSSRTYIDLFSGCGGLSLGLGKAGWRGIFAIEKDPMAFSTFRFNMVDPKSRYSHFDWVDWLPVEPTTIQKVLKNHMEQLKSLNRKVDLIAGGPPCQGFSLAGMRNSNDPRNKMSHEYIKMVRVVEPKFLLLENVKGFSSTFKDENGGPVKKPYSEIVKKSLEKIGYKVFYDFVHCERFGVPQERTRFIMIGIRGDIVRSDQIDNPFSVLEQLRPSLLKSIGLSDSTVSVKDAISDLETGGANSKMIDNMEYNLSGYKQLDYNPYQALSPYQKLMRIGLVDQKPCSMRLARHKDSTIKKFKLIQQIARPGYTLGKIEKEIIGTKKQAICVLDPDRPSNTITTLPDDLLHYSEPRILTVRESARIQSFPDDFEFKGKYTTGGKHRKSECPRYTQVGNAVPPLLGESLGILINNIGRSLNVG